MARVSFLVFLIILSIASSASIDINGVEDDYEEGDERTIFTSGGTYYIALNTTYLIFYALAGAALLLAGLALTGAFAGQPASSGYGSQYANSQRQRAGEGQGDFRSKREAEGKECYYYWSGKRSFIKVLLLSPSFKRRGLLY